MVAGEPPTRARGRSKAFKRTFSRVYSLPEGGGRRAPPRARRDGPEPVKRAFSHTVFRRVRGDGPEPSRERLVAFTVFWRVVAGEPPTRARGWSMQSVVAFRVFWRVGWPASPPRARGDDPEPSRERLVAFRVFRRVVAPKRARPPT